MPGGPLIAIESCSAAEETRARWFISVCLLGKLRDEIVQPALIQAGAWEVRGSVPARLRREAMGDQGAQLVAVCLRQPLDGRGLMKRQDRKSTRLNSSHLVISNA